MWRIVLRISRPKIGRNQCCCGVAAVRVGVTVHPVCRPHSTETTARPLAPRPRHRTRPYRKEIAYLSNPHTLTFRRIWVVPSSKTVLKSNRQPAASSILVHTELAGAKNSVPRRSMSQSWATLCPRDCGPLECQERHTAGNRAIRSFGPLLLPVAHARACTRCSAQWPHQPRQLAMAHLALYRRADRLLAGRLRGPPRRRGPGSRSNGCQNTPRNQAT